MNEENKSPVFEAEAMIASQVKKETQGFQPLIDGLTDSLKNMQNDMQNMRNDMQNNIEEKKSINPKFSVNTNNLNTLEGGKEEFKGLEVSVKNIFEIATSTGNRSSVSFYDKNSTDAVKNSFAKKINQNAFKEETKSTYNSFNNIQGGYSIANPLFGGLMDINAVSSSQLFQYCSKIALGNRVAGEVNITRYDLHPVATSSFTQTKELTASQQSDLVDLSQKKLSLAKYTTYSEISIDMYRQQDQDGVLFNVLDLHNQAVDVAQMKTLDAMYFTGMDSTKGGVLRSIQTNDIQTIESETAGIFSIKDIMNAFFALKPVYRKNATLIISNVAFRNLVLAVSQGSGEYLNIPFFFNQNDASKIQIGGMSMNLIVVDQQAIINQSNADKFKGFEDTMTSGSLVAIVTDLEKAVKYLTSSAVYSGLTPITKGTIQGESILFYKDIFAGFDVIIPEASKAIRIK